MSKRKEGRLIPKSEINEELRAIEMEQCYHEIKGTPRCGYYFRFLEEYLEYGFIL